MMTPGVRDGVGGSDTGTSWVTAWSEPMVLWSTGRPGSQACVLSSVYGVGQYMIAELYVIGNDSRGQVMR